MNKDSEPGQYGKKLSGIRPHSPPEHLIDLVALCTAGNGGGNTLVGEGALALLYTDGLDTITGFDPRSQQVAIVP